MEDDEVRDDEVEYIESEPAGELPPLSAQHLSYYYSHTLHWDLTLRHSHTAKQHTHTHTCSAFVILLVYYTHTLGSTTLTLKHSHTAELTHTHTHGQHLSYYYIQLTQFCTASEYHTHTAVQHTHSDWNTPTVQSDTRCNTLILHFHQHSWIRCQCISCTFEVHPRVFFLLIMRLDAL